MIFVLRGLLFLKALLVAVKAQCYLLNPSLKTLCYSCSYVHNYNFPDDWPGGEVPFNSSACAFMLTRPKLEIYVSPKQCMSGSPCNGSIDSPFDSLVKAFKFGWRSNATELKYFLLSDEKDPEESNHFINKFDYVSDFQYLFRRFYADISISPLYCATINKTGCIKNINLRPTIYVRTQSLYIFVAKNFNITNITFDGSDLIMAAKNLINSSQSRTRICNDSDLTSAASPCYMKGILSAPSSSKSYGLFNTETPIECTNCISGFNKDVLLLENTELRNFHSLGGDGDYYLGSLITTQPLRFNIRIRNSTFQKFLFSNGLINSIPMPDIYSLQEVDYGTAQDKIKEKLFVFELSTVRDYNPFNALPNTLSSVAMFINFNQISFDIVLNFSSFYNNFITGAPGRVTYFVLTQVLEFDEKLNNTFNINNNQFDRINSDYLLVYKRFAESFKNISFIITDNNFSNLQNGCFEYFRSFIFYDRNNFSNLSFDSCSLIEITNGNLFMNNAQFSLIKDKFKGILVFFKGDQVLPDKTIFFNTSMTNKSYLESFSMEGCSFYEINVGLMSGSSILNYFIFRNNKIFDLGNPIVDLLKGKVERDFNVSNNSFVNVSVFSLLNFETFKNLTFCSNSLVNVSLSWIMKTTLFSPNRPFYTISIQANYFIALLFLDTGFQANRFSEQTGISFIINDNYIDDLAGSLEGALFSFLFTTVEFVRNQIKGFAMTTLLKLYALEPEPREVTVKDCAIESSSQLKMEYFLFVVDFRLLTVTNSTFYGHGVSNSRMAMGYFLSTFGYLNIENSSFENLSSITSGALMIKLGSIRNLRVFNCIFSANTAFDLAGDMTLELVQKDPDFFLLPFYQFVASSIDFGIVNNTFRRSKGGSGGCLRILESSQILLMNNLFLGTKALKGGCIYLSQRSELISKRDKFENGEAQVNGGFLFLLESSLKLIETTFIDSLSSKGGVLFAEASDVTMDYVSIKNSSADVGGAIFSQASSLTIFYIVVSSTLAEQDGGALYIKAGNLKVRNAYFNQSTARYLGACVYVEGPKLLSLERVWASNSEASIDGIIMILGTSGQKHFLRDIKCLRNSVGGKGECIYIKEGYYVVEEVEIKQNLVKSCALCFLSLKKSSHVSLVNISMDGNIFEKSALIFSGVSINVLNFAFLNASIHPQFTFLFLINANCSAQNLSFEAFDRASRFISAESSTITARYLKLDLHHRLAGILASRTKLYLLQVVILQANCSSEEDGYGGSFRLDQSDFTLEASKISNSKAILGSTMFAIESNIKIIDSLISGDLNDKNSIHFYLSGLVESGIMRAGLLAERTRFVSCPGFRSKNQRAVEFKMVLFDQSRSNIGFTSSLSLEEAGTISIVSSIFKGIYADFASAIQIKSNRTVMNLTLSFIQVESCKSSDSGGGLRIEGKIAGKVSRCLFKNNTSVESGGALFVNIYKGDAGLAFENCSFVANTAGKYGNIMKIIEQIPKFDNEDSSFFSEVSSYPRKFLLLPGGDWDILELSSSLMKEGVRSYDFQFVPDLKDVASGQAFGLAVIVVDHFNNLLFLDSTGKVSFSNAFPGNQTISFENEAVRAKNGIALFKDLRFIAEPGGSYSVNLTYYDELTRVEFSQTTQLDLRVCVRGEIYSGMRCQICPENTFSLDTEPMKNKNPICEPCKPNSVCPGGRQIFPQEGYWRKDENQTLVLKCKMREACPPYVIKIFSLARYRFQPNCSVKYRGRLCYNCIAGHGKADTKECILCSMNLAFILKYALLVLFSLSISAYQIWTAFSIDVTWSKRRCLLKLLIDHFTYIGLLSRFNIDWTATIQTLLNINDTYLTVIPSEMFNFDCFISRYYESERKFSLNSILVSFSPFFYGTINLLMVYFIKGPTILWKKILSFIKNKRNRIGGKAKVITVKTSPSNPQSEDPKKAKVPGLVQNIFATALIIFYNFYPRLLMNGMIWLRCIEIDDSGTLVLENNPDIFCWTRDHMDHVLGISVPTLICWSICTPLLLFYLTVRMKRIVRTGKSTIWEQLMDFISIDYQDRYYYWDLFSYISKFTVVFCAIATNGLEPASQGALLILMMLGVFLVHEKLRPYKYGFVNDMFTSSYIVTICTAAFAIMASARGLTENQRFAYMLALIGINIMFYLAWAYYFIKEGADWEASRSFMKDYIHRVSKNVSARLSRFSRFGPNLKSPGMKISDRNKKLSQMGIPKSKPSLLIQIGQNSNLK